MRINKEYIYDRHDGPACDEDKWEKGPKPATELMRRHDKAKKYVVVNDDEFILIDELVTGAWLYEDADTEQEWDMIDSHLKMLMRNAAKIRARWERDYYKRKEGR